MRLLLCNQPLSKPRRHLYFGGLVAQLYVQLLVPLGIAARTTIPRLVVTQEKTTDWQASQQSAVGRLARFFPDATPVRIPVNVSAGSREKAGSEATVIEFGTAREALFACQLPLEFAEKVRLRNADGSFDADAWVVALHYHNGQAAVAARFVHEPAHWVIK